MAGLYIHIPFCRSRCIYCGFYSITLLDMRQQYVDALCEEMRLRGRSDISTIYIGGGTPSLLTPEMLRQLFDTIDRVYDVSPSAEVTMECNPDDVTDKSASLLRQFPINRVSMGIQSFDDRRLRFLHRRHTALQGHQAVDSLRQAGIDNISIDLMFGFPGQTVGDWDKDIAEALCLHVEHISAYSLMYESGTPLAEMLARHEVEETDDDLYIIMYQHLADRLREAGYLHYEISNFALPGRQSRHNSSYWDGSPYIGIGAAAHSYDCHTRSWNVADIRQYVSDIADGLRPCEEEQLTATDHYNDLIATAMRTSSGISTDNLRARFGEATARYFMENARPYIDKGWLAADNGHVHLTLEGIAMSDTIMSDLIKIE